MVKKARPVGAKWCVFVSGVPYCPTLNSAATLVSAAMAAETYQKIKSVANMLMNMGIPEPKVQRETPPPVQFDMPQPKPIREALLKLKLRKETVDKLSQVYTRQINEYRSGATRELQLLWRDLHIEGSHTPLRAWEKALLLTQRKVQQTLDDLFNMVVNHARDHVAAVGTNKPTNQPVFDQVSI